MMRPDYEAELAQDIRYPQITVRLMGRSLPLIFNHTAMYLAEVYNMEMTGRRVNYLALLNMASGMMYSGMAALIYGAAAAAPGGNGLNPILFDRLVTMQDCLDVREDVIRAAFDALPDVAGVKTKNAKSRTASPDTRGSG